jgi:hypothetical protein
MSFFTVVSPWNSERTSLSVLYTTKQAITIGVVGIAAARQTYIVVLECHSMKKSLSSRASDSSDQLKSTLHSEHR